MTSPAAPPASELSPASPLWAWAQEAISQRLEEMLEPIEGVRLGEDIEAVHDMRVGSRRLVAAGCSIDHCLVYYERGGIAHTWQVALFHWTPAATRFEWGGTAPGGLKTIDDVRSAVLTGLIKSPNKVW